MYARLITVIVNIAYSPLIYTVPSTECKLGPQYLETLSSDLDLCTIYLQVEKELVLLNRRLFEKELEERNKLGILVSLSESSSLLMYWYKWRSDPDVSVSVKSHSFWYSILSILKKNNLNAWIINNTYFVWKSGQELFWCNSTGHIRSKPYYLRGQLTPLNYYMVLSVGIAHPLICTGTWSPICNYVRKDCVLLSSGSRNTIMQSRELPSFVFWSVALMLSRGPISLIGP